MRKIFTLFVMSFIMVQFVSAQTVVRDEQVNFSQLAAYEAAHPELFKPCPTCPRREADGGWEEFNLPSQPIPPGATIRMAPPIPKRDPNEPRREAPSRAPSQTFLGHVDPGSIIPPDTYGAVGLNHVITATNDFIRIHNKVGGAVVSTVSVSGFTGVPSTCDPQLWFDPSTQRWLFVAIGCGGNGNAVVVMASNTSDPTGTWRNYQFVPLPGGFMDHPYMGYDDTKIVIGGRKFTPGFSGPEIYLIDKAAFLAGTAITFGTNAQTITRTAADGDAPRPVTEYAPPISNTGDPQSNTVYILQSWSNNSLRLSTITGSIPSCVWNTATAVFPTAPDSWTAGNQGNSVQQLTETRRVASNDARVSSAVMMNGKIWAAQHIAFPAGASGTSVTHIDAQYWQLDAASGTFGNVIQRGRTGAVAGQYRWFSGIAVNKNEDVILGYSNSSTTQFIGSAYSTRQSGTPVNTLDDPLEYKAGEATYWKDFGSGRTRWGDYSKSHLDPVDNSLWTIQQYASARVGSGDNASRYGVYWAQVPSSITIPTPSISGAGWTLVSESCVPANGVVDPGETVTVSFCLQNTGTAATVNAVGTLQATGGITPVTTTRTYGVITNGGPSVCQNYTFTNTSSTCGGTLTASIQVQDGASNLGTVSYTIPLGTFGSLTSQNFDGVAVPALPAGWTLITASGNAWATSNSGTPAPAAFSAPNAAFADDPGAVADKSLVTPTFTPAVGARASFRSNYNTESGFDGGVLEISINGGAWQDIIAAGGSFVSGGYTGTLATGFGNPLPGRQAWTGNSSGFIQTVVNLPVAAANQNVQLRFRMGSDNSFGVDGWRVDDFDVSQPSCCGTPCVLTCPANITVGNTSGLCGANVTFAASTTGLCGPIIYSRAPGSFFPIGTTTVNVSTASGATCSFTVTVTDTQAPTITCPANITVGNTPNQCNATVNYADPSVTDNCPLPGTLSLTQNTNNNTIAVGTGIACGAGDNHFWRAYNLAPLALTSPLTIAGVRFGVEQNGTAQTATVRVYTSAGPFPASARTLVGTATVNITTAPATFYTASFTTPPTVPANAIVAIEVEVMNGGMWPGANQLGESAPAYVSSGTCGVPTPVTLASLGFTSNTIIDLIGRVPVVPPVLSLVSGLPSGSVFPVGTTTNTWQARDAVGNTSTCSFTVTVVDNQQPNITCPANQTRNTDPGQCYATYTPPQPTFSDNCAVTRLTWSISGPGGFAASSPAAGINYVPATQFPLDGRTGSGVSTVTYTAFDAAGNSRTCSFTVTVNDAERPVITQQPVTQYVCVNDNALFPIIANVGTGTILTYQWQGWNGTAWVNIAGATSATLTIPSVTFALNTNSYRCILSGRCTDVTSNFATLYINPLPTVNVVTSIPPVLTPGQVLSISSTVSPTGGSYRWYKNGVMLTNPLQQLSVLSGLTVDDIGSYQLEYTDLNGCKARSQTVVVSGQQSDNLWVYPNPNSGQFQVRFYNTSGETATIRVFDEKGAQVYTKSMVTGLAYTRIDINLGPTIADGNYTVELVNGSGKRVGAKQIIVKKN